MIDTFLVLLIGIGPKLALIPFLQITAPLARRAGEPAGQGENVPGEVGWVEDLELGTEDGHIDGEHVR